jgi:hypothetical protein
MCPLGGSHGSCLVRPVWLARVTPVDGYSWRSTAVTACLPCIMRGFQHVFVAFRRPKSEFKKLVSAFATACHVGSAVWELRALLRVGASRSLSRLSHLHVLPFFPFLHHNLQALWNVGLRGGAPVAVLSRLWEPACLMQQVLVLCGHTRRPFRRTPRACMEVPPLFLLTAGS